MNNRTKINWISVNELLPEDGDRCLIWDESCHVSYDGTPETIYHIYIATFEKGEPWCWNEGARRWFMQDVTHWAYLPDWREDPNE